MNDEKNNLSTADQVGEAAGGITGVLAGAALGSTAGPIGTVLGGIAGAIGGWWSGRALAEAAEDITEAEDKYYCDHFSSSDNAGCQYDDVRGAYYIGDLAAANPDYASFEDAERDVARGWSKSGDRRAEWLAIRDYAAVGFQRGRERRRTPR
jgi:hypothetical protein